MDTATSYTTRSLNHLGIIAGICEKIKLVENIDRCFPDQNEKRSLSVGEASKALILNALGFVSRPLYLTPEFFRNKPVELLFRDGLTPDDFNDDSLGRALDILFEGGLTELFAYVASKALLTYGISHKGKHLDTTSLSFQGKYLDPSDSSTGESLPKEEVSPDNYDPKPILITYGHSKDKRPDLKQAVVSLITEHQSSIPVWLQVLDGNTSDKTHFPKAIENYIEQVGLSEETYFKMDSAFYGEKNIQENADVGWISRVPETIKEAKRVIEETLQEEMQAVEGEEGYKIKTVESHYGKVKQRWIVVYSEKAYDREEKAFEKKRKTAQDSAERELKKIGKQEFACESDALQAVKKVEKKWKYHRAEVEIKEVERYKKAGRPKEGEKATKLSFIVEGKVVEEEETVKKERRNFGKFILATNLAEEKKSAKEVLIEYKGQGTSVERGFRF